MNSISIDAVVRGIRDLPKIPAVITELLAELDDPHLNVNQAAELIGRNPAVAAKLLRLANSSFYGMSGRVTSTKDAVRLLGIGQLRKLVFAVSLIRHLPAPAGFDRLAFWDHAISAGLCAHTIALKIRWDADVAFTAGILHDIGKLVMAIVKPDLLDEVGWLWAGTCVSASAERDALGMDHGEVGFELARQWRFPAIIQIAIRDHHQPDATPGDALTDIVHVASLLCEDVSELDSEATLAALSRLELTPVSVERLRERIVPQIENAALLVDT